MAINLGSAILDMSARVARIQGDLGKAAAAIERFKRNTDRVLAGIGGGLSILGFASFVKGAIDAADTMNDLQRRTGIAAQDLLVLKGAAERSGVGLEDVSATLSKLPKQLDDAAKGTGDAAAAFGALGIKVTDSRGQLRSAFDVLAESGAKFAEFEDGSDKARLAIAAFGKGGDRLIQLAESIEETRKRYQQLGITLEQDVIDRSDKFNDTLKDISDQTAQTARQLAAALLPTLQRLAEIFIEVRQDGRSMAEAFGVIETAIKGLVSAGIIVTTVFQAVGKGVGALVAAAAQPASIAGLRNAFEILKEGATDVADDVKKSIARIGQVWDGAAKGVTTYDQAVSRAGKRPAPRLPDLTEVKKVNEALLKLLETRAKIEVDTQKALSGERLKLLERFYRDGLIAEADYWTARLAVQQQALNAELAAIDKEVQARQAALGKATPGSADYLNAQRELEQALATRNKLELEFKNNAIDGYFDALKSAEEYADSVQALNTQLAELQGRSAEAAAVRFDQSHRTLRTRLETNQDEPALATLGALRKATISQAEFNDVRERSETLNRQLAISEERIQNALRTRAISELEAMSQTSAARQAAIGELQATADAMQRIAEESGNRKLVLEAEEFRVKLEELAGQADLLADKFNTIFEESIGDNLAAVITRTKSVKDAFRDMVSDITGQITKLASQDIARKIFGGGEGGGGIGALLSGIFGGRKAAAPAGGGIDAGLGGLFGLAFGGAFAGGGDVSPGMRYKVGESGPEWFVPRAAGRIEPGGGSTMNVVQNFTLAQPADTRTQLQVGQQAEFGLRRARRNA